MSTSYPLSDQLSIAFSALEDRLVVRSHNTNGQKVWLLLTRRMTLMVLQQLLQQLHRISDLNKTPAQYWLEVLQMDHQQAMQAKQATDKQAAAYSPPLPASENELNPVRRAESAAKSSADSDSSLQELAVDAERAIFIATSIHLDNYPRYALLAFKGLPMPSAMTTPSPHVPVFAIRLTRDHLHQLIRLLISKAKEAHWELPVNLPWLQLATEQNTSLDLGLLH